MTPGINMTVIRSAGSMTLYLELWDSMTNAILARVMDSQADQGAGGQIADSVTNTAAADFILRRWADTLRKNLEAARSALGQAAFETASSTGRAWTLEETIKHALDSTTSSPVTA